MTVECLVLPAFVVGTLIVELKPDGKHVAFDSEISQAFQHFVCSCECSGLVARHLLVQYTGPSLTTKQWNQRNHLTWRPPVYRHCCRLFGCDPKNDFGNHFLAFLVLTITEICQPCRLSSLFYVYPQVRVLPEEPFFAWAYCGRVAMPLCDCAHLYSIRHWYENRCPDAYGQCAGKPTVSSIHRCWSNTDCHSFSDESQFPHPTSLHD